MFGKGGFFKSPAFIEVADYGYINPDKGGFDLVELFGGDIAEREYVLAQKANMMDITAKDYFGNKLAQKEELIDKIFTQAVKQAFRFLLMGKFIKPTVLSEDQLTNIINGIAGKDDALNNFHTLSGDQVLGKKIKQVIQSFINSMVHWVETSAVRITGENLHNEVLDKHTY